VTLVRSGYERETDPEPVKSYEPHHSGWLDSIDTHRGGGGHQIVFRRPEAPYDETQVLFDHLADEWEQATAFSSMSAQSTCHPAYLSIIGLGPKALPLVLQRMRERPTSGDWFVALRAITRTDPAARARSVSEAVDAWLSWGGERELVH
jgi:hypothetical protein